MSKNTLLLSTMLCSMLLVQPAIAQVDGGASTSAQADDTSYTDTIVVTARRRAEDASKVPVAITAFSGAQLVAKGIQNTLDLVKITPGLNITGGATRTNPYIVIRGQSKSVTGNGSPGVITYMNDVPLPTNGSLIQTYDMENIQVLKGPQGTLFGRNTIGGALLTVTKAPTYDFSGYVMADIAQYNNQQIEGAINIPVVTDKIALRLAAQFGHSNGNIKTYQYTGYNLANPSPGVYVATPGSLVPSTRNVDEFQSRSFRASLLIEPTDWIRSVTVADYSKIRGGASSVLFDYIGGIYSLQPAQIQAALAGGSTDPNRIFFANTYANTIIPALAQCGSDPRCDVNLAVSGLRNAVRDRISVVTSDPWTAFSTIKGISNTTTIQLGSNHQLKNIFAYRTTEAYTNTSLTGLPIPLVNSFTNTRIAQLTEEVQLSGTLFQDLKYTVGGFFYNEKPNGLGGYQGIEVNSFFGLSHTLSTTYLHNKSQAVYGQLDYSLDRLIEGLSLTAGLRQTWDQQSACTTDITISPLQPGDGRVLGSFDRQEGVIPSEDECRKGVGPNIGRSNIFQEAKFKKLTYTLSANWQLTPSTLFYLAHRRGYRAGGYNTPLLDNGSAFLSNVQTFQPETLTDWELGTKLRFRAGGVRGSLDLALFTGKDKNNQLPVNVSGLGAGVCVPSALGTPGHAVSDCALNTVPGALVSISQPTLQVNGGELTIRGVEASGTLSPVPGITLSGSVAYTQVRVDKVSIDPNFRAFLLAAGKPEPTDIKIQGQPKWNGNLGVNFTYPDKVLGGDLNASLDYHYTGSMRAVEITLPSYQTVDVRVGVDDIGETGLSAAVYIRNLTDATIYNGGSSNALSIGALSYMLGMPRLVGVNLSYRFGGK